MIHEIKVNNSVYCYIGQLNKVVLLVSIGVVTDKTWVNCIKVGDSVQEEWNM
jgi:hypothetical protein